MAAKAKKIKTKAAKYVPASREEVDAAIGQIGTLQREFQTIETNLNEQLARLKSEAATDAAPIAATIQTLSAGVQTWCEANRAELLKGGSKTVRFNSGDCRWRKCPPSVSLRDVEDVIARLKAAELPQFIRSTESVNKEAILEAPDAVAEIKGIKVNTENEDFLIVPFETDLEVVVS